MEITGSVAPLAGAWIETTICTMPNVSSRSVAPLAGAWIETCGAIKELAEGLRAPRGRVD